jgi:AcrR family transcriptional regulator
MPTQAPGPASGPKDRLLGLAVDFLTERGLGDISLRELAAALGTSHRMLIYHFGSKEGLYVEVIRETERRQQAALAGLFEESDGDLADLTRRFWRRLSAPELAPLERLFFEVYGQALQGRPYAVPVLDGVVDSWIETAVPVLKGAGLSDRDARAEARLGLAVVRGLLLDLLATGDTRGVEDALERHLAGRRADNQSWRAAGE